MQYYDNEIYTKYPHLLKYFNQGIKSETKSIGHLLLFWGPNINAQCSLALEIARLLNCSKDKSIECECINCRGIREQAHEAVKIYTRLDYKEATNSDSSDTENRGKKNITIEQAKSIIKDISLTSIYHRVFIFCDRDENGNLLPLNKINFPEATANALLKTFEEPTQNSMFIILTKDCTDVISTIVSRAQTFFVPSCIPQDYTFELIEEIINDYTSLSKENVFDFADKLFELATNNDSILILQHLQNYIHQLIISNAHNQVLFIKLTNDLKLIETAIKQLSLTPSMSVRTVIDNLCYKLIS